jgi:hypothetical protein
LPNSRLKDILHLSGVRKLLEYRLDETTRLARFRFAAMASVFLVLSTLALAGTILIQLRGNWSFGAASDTPSSHAVRLETEIGALYGSQSFAYRQEPIGEAIVTNLTVEALTGCRVQLEIQGSRPGILAEPCRVSLPQIEPGERVRVALRPKLSDRVLDDRTREVTVAVSVTREDTLLAKDEASVFILGRHVFSWEEPEKIAAFINPQDPVVRRFKTAAWVHRPPVGNEEFPPPRVVDALTLLTALADLGLHYLPDGRDPLSQSVDDKASDTVSYPGETLLARTGDCDDLSVLCCTVLESVGIHTALVVAPGHVLFLFDTGVSSASLPRTPLDPKTVIARGERVWMPVEATALARPGANFASAWSAAWVHHEAITSGEMEVVELAEPMLRYPAISPEPEATSTDWSAPSSWEQGELARSIDAALESLRGLFYENLSDKVAEIEGALEGLAQEQAKALLFAESGLFEEAKKILEHAIFGDDTPEALSAIEEVSSRLTEEKAILLADLALCYTLGMRVSEDLKRAATCFQLAIEHFPVGARAERAEMMLRLALVHRLRGDLLSERAWSSRAFELDPELENTYRTLIQAEAVVAGPAGKILRYLRRGFQ